jgi:hypothetical protein
MSEIIRIIQELLALKDAIKEEVTSHKAGAALDDLRDKNHPRAG